MSVDSRIRLGLRGALRWSSLFLMMGTISKMDLKSPCYGPVYWRPNSRYERVRCFLVLDPCGLTEGRARLQKHIHEWGHDNASERNLQATLPSSCRANFWMWYRGKGEKSFSLRKS